ncbi:FAD dependent oxidoreductase [Mobilisporobacter senegalensis]|uniref:FAD dependent oxidoreductase n=1 Tax=Mobilisporobacter senegalensis TaxID=1329262 RepID=A0A3N1XBG3_9FIRM|nr:FAD-dependent oxidoreductase [Mobilisporobacter senegalensis]ROR23431.1 FAD dependent oxidoreductase [Mobilisporobacter senegalensis]
MNSKYDVCIAGGGVAGCAAAIAAARNGAKTFLIEECGYLGGSLTLCGVGPMMTYFAGKNQIIKGIGEEIVSRLISKNGSCGHIKDTTGYVSYTTPFSSEILKLVLDEMMEEENVQVLFHTSVAKAFYEEGKIREIIVSNCDGISKIQGKIFIDATGDGDLAAMSGVLMTKGRKIDGQMQPMTMNVKYSNINIEKLKSYILEHIEEFPRLTGKEELIRSSEPMAVAGFSKQIKDAINRNELSIPREELLFFETNIPGEVIVNTTRVIGLDPTNAFDLTKAEQIGRKQCFELDRFLHNEIPGFEKAIMEYTGPKIGARSSRQLVGVYTLTAEDILSHRSFSTKICLSAYPIDIHNPSGAGTESAFLSDPNYSYELPYEILYSDKMDNMLVAGRCVSASFEAQAAIRTTPTVFALGQAAGTAAALCALQNKKVSEIDIRELQEKLMEQDVIL